MLILGAVYWFATNDSASASKPVETASRDTTKAPSSAAVDAVPHDERRLTDDDAPPVTVESLPPVPSSAPAQHFTGQFVFADGSVPPELSFSVSSTRLTGNESAKSLYEEAERARAGGECTRWASHRTEPEGRFDIEGLCPGQYRFRLDSTIQLGSVNGVYDAPGQDVRIVLDGYLLELHVVDALSMPVPRADVVAIYTPVSNAPGEKSMERRLTASAKDDGIAVFCLPRAGICKIRAITGLQYSSDLELSLAGPSGTLRRTIVLDRAYAGASLRVVVVSCDQSAVPVDNYCLNLVDAVHGERVHRLHSEDAEADGAFRGLRPGRYLVEAAQRYRGGPVLYPVSAQTDRVATELVDDRESVLELCVHLGGRLSVLVTGEYAAEVDTRKAKIELLSVDSSKPIRLGFREAHADSVSVDGSLALGIRRLTENVLAPGTYLLTASIKGGTTTEQVVVVTAGQITDVDVTLPLEKQ